MQKTLNLCNIGTPFKLLFTGYLCTIALGYLLAIAQILFTHGMADGKIGLSLEDVVYNYYGNRSGSILEKKLNGSMKMNASDAERFKIIQWVRDSADEQTFNREMTKNHHFAALRFPDFQRRCICDTRVKEA
jgi:hypothetical protein